MLTGTLTIIFQVYIVLKFFVKEKFFTYVLTTRAGIKSFKENSKHFVKFLTFRLNTKVSF